jgi:hypothetical protein
MLMPACARTSLMSCQSLINLRSLNVFRIYRAVERHLAAHPEDAHRFPNFNPENRPILVKGSAKPLEGNIHGAQYFHGRYA